MAKRKKQKTGTDIVDKWKDSFKDGFSGVPGRKLDAAIAAKYGPMLADFVQKRLDAGIEFTKEAEKNTNEVAKDLGKICRLLTKKSKTISLDVFDAAFPLAQNFHDACMSAGAGAWCGG